MIERWFLCSGLINVIVPCSSKSSRRGDISLRRLSFMVLLLLAVVAARAAEDTKDTKLDSPSGLGTAQPESLIKERLDSSDLHLGKGDWVVGGPVVDSLRRRQPAENRSLGRRILELPIIRLFVPKQTASRSDTEVYYVGRESSRPWASIASDARRPGSPDNPLYLEGGCALVSFSR